MFTDTHQIRAGGKRRAATIKERGSLASWKEAESSTIRAGRWRLAKAALNSEYVYTVLYVEDVR